MEPQIILYLKNIVKTICLGLLWMATSVYWGIHKNFGFFKGSVQWQNLVFYICSFTALVILLWYLRKVWKQPFDMKL